MESFGGPWAYVGWDEMGLTHCTQHTADCVRPPRTGSGSGRRWSRTPSRRPCPLCFVCVCVCRGGKVRVVCVREPAASPPAGPAGPAGSGTSRAVDFFMHIYVSMYALLVVVLTAVGRAAGVATAASVAAASLGASIGSSAGPPQADRARLRARATAEAETVFVTVFIMSILLGLAAATLYRRPAAVGRGLASHGPHCRRFFANHRAAASRRPRQRLSGGHP